jgi:hypothetical protein
MLAERTVLSVADAGREAAQRLYREGLKAQIEDPLTPGFARAAVAEFSRLQREHTPGIYLEALEAAEAGAEDLNIDEYHGVIEVVQNADDAAGRELRIAVRSRAGGRDLLFVHDGEAVRLPDLIAMALAFLSTKRDDPHSKGRFGIGLKTLKRLGDTLTVHCGPYHTRSWCHPQFLSPRPRRNDARAPAAAWLLDQRLQGLVEPEGCQLDALSRIAALDHARDSADTQADGLVTARGGTPSGEDAHSRAP